MKKILLLVFFPLILFAQTAKTVSPVYVKARIADSLVVVRAEIALKAPLTVTDSLASDIAENKLTTHFFSGTDSIHYGQDSIVVTHGVGSTPQFIAIQLISDGFGFQTWISGINSITFYVRRSDVGLETITSYIKFKWMAYK